MADFKVGDRVRVIDSVGGGEVGDVGEIYEIDNRFPQDPFYRIGGLSHQADGLFGSRLELVLPFKVGDRVRVTEENLGYGNVGDEGFVTVEDAGSKDFMVRLDQKRSGYYEWFFPWTSLEAVADPFADWDYDPSSGSEKPSFKVGDRVYAAWGSIEGDGVIVAEDSSKGGMQYAVNFDTAFSGGPLWVYDETIRLLDEPDLDEPDAPLTVSITADTSQLDAEIDRIFGRLTDLQSLATSLGIRFGTGQLQDA